MLGIGTFRDLRAAADNEIRRLRDYDWKAFAANATDTAVRGIMAGLSARELRAILRGDEPTERPNPRYKAQVKSFILHLRPKYYQRASTWFTHTWRLGWFSVFFFFVETITGLILMLFYAPTPERAYGDMLHLLGNVPFGKFMRDMHRLGAEGMVAVVILHMLRVYLTGSYKGPRKFTWFTGAILLIVTLFLSFSGYLLPWDQLAYWAVTIGTSMAEAGPVIGPEVNLLLRGAVDIWAGGLLRFYLLHIFLLPLLAFLFISIHYYKVAREHSISLPARIEEGENLDPDEKRHAEERIDLLPNLVIHETMLTSLALFLMVLIVGTFYSAPLEAHADPQVTPLHTEAPWYFLWLQGMLKLGDKTLFGVVLPTVIFGVLFVVPWIDQNPHRLASKRKAALAIGMIFSVMMVILTYMGTPGFGIETPPAQNILSHFVPATHPGPVRETPWEQIEAMPDGSPKTYFVSYPEAFLTDPRYQSAQYEFIEEISLEPENEWYAILDEFKAEVEHQVKLIPPVHGDAALAHVTVELIQPDLKWINFTITWDELILDDDGDPTERIVFDRVRLDPVTEEPMLDNEGEPIIDKDQVTIFRDEDDEPFYLSPAGDEVRVEGDTFGWPTVFLDNGRIVEGEIELNLANLQPNIKRSQQVAQIALHRDSNYE